MSYLLFDTIYQSLKKGVADWGEGYLKWRYNYTYFKFFEDGTLIYCTCRTGLRYMQWFNKGSENPVIMNGRYKIRDSKIEISIPFKAEAITYKGRIYAKSLLLRSFSERLALKEGLPEISLHTLFVVRKKIRFNKF